jgi:hypothetical protein
MALDIPEEKVWPVVYGLNSDDLLYTHGDKTGQTKALCKRFLRIDFQELPTLLRATLGFRK